MQVATAEASCFFSNQSSCSDVTLSTCPVPSNLQPSSVLIGTWYRHGVAYVIPAGTAARLYGVRHETVNVIAYYRYSSPSMIAKRGL